MSDTKQATEARAEKHTVRVPDGTRFDLEFAGQTVELEVMTVTSAAQELQTRHNLQPGDKGVVEPTAEFLEDLAVKLFGEDGDAGTTEAWAAWQKATQMFDEVKKKLELMLNSPTGTS